jgi:hypothetical protein
MSDFADWLTSLRLHKKQQKPYHQHQEGELAKLSTSDSSDADTDVDTDEDNGTYDQFMFFSQKSEDLFHDDTDSFGMKYSRLSRRRSAPILIPTQNYLHNNLNNPKVESTKQQPLQFSGNEEERNNFYVDDATFLLSKQLQFHLSYSNQSSNTLFLVHSSVENDQEHEDIFQLEL